MKNCFKILFRGKKKKNTKLLFEVEKCFLTEKPEMPNNSRVAGYLAIIPAILLVFFMVITVVFAVYQFLHVSGLTNLAGVHVTPAISAAANELVNGKEVPISGFEDWITCKNNFFSLKHPVDWNMQIIDKETIELKKFNSTGRQGMESLAAILIAKAVQPSEKLSIKDIVEEKGVKWNDNWKEKLLAGEKGIHTGQFKAINGIIKDLVFWQIDGRVYSLEISYLSINNIDNQKIFEKIITQFKFN